MRFLFQIEDRGEIAFQLDQPGFAHGGRSWGCRVRWSGLERGEREIYGASSLQSVELALFFVRSWLEAAYSGLRITQDGAPFV